MRVRIWIEGEGPGVRANCEPVTLQIANESEFPNEEVIKQTIREQRWPDYHRKHADVPKLQIVAQIQRRGAKRVVIPIPADWL